MPDGPKGGRTMHHRQAGATVLVVGGEESAAADSGKVLRREGVGRIVFEGQSEKVPWILEEQEISLILLDLDLPDLAGHRLLRELHAGHPHIPVIVLAAARELELAVACMRQGAFDYLVKPVELRRVVSSARTALQGYLRRRQTPFPSEPASPDGTEEFPPFAPIVTCSPKMKSIFRYLTAIAGTDQSVLITGETGVGKELVARSLHDASGRSGEFIAVNVAGLDDHLFSDSLFGHAKGAFTGAEQYREGLVARAAGGTLFLDEIGDLSQHSQIKLLRLLQEKEYYPLGADRPVKSLGRVVVATNSDLHRKMEDGHFRNDLFYRLSAHQVRIPPLRERLEDLPLLVNAFLEEASHVLGKRRPPHPAELMSYLCSCAFPGNVRQLKAMVFDAVARHRKGMLSLASFRDTIGAGSIGGGRDRLAGPDLVAYLQQAGIGSEAGACLPTLKEAEAALIARALECAGGNQGVAASYLGITRQALNKRLIRGKGSKS